MSINKLDRSLPIFELLECRPLPRDCKLELMVASFVTRVKRTSMYVPKYYDVDEHEERNDIITKIHWEIDVTVAKLYLIQYDVENESLTVGLHFIELGEYNNPDYHIQKLESYTIWPKREPKPVAKLDRSMPIFKMLEQLERPYCSEVRLHLNTYKRKHNVHKKYSIKYYDTDNSLTVGLHIYDREWGHDAEHYYDEEYVADTYEEYTIW